jgi:signal transduction histidine kinase
VTVSVHDEGGHIPQERIASLFERFVRLDRSRSAATGGAGLGLSICREVVTRHGGQISIDSDPQRGTTVSVTLPRADYAGAS